MIHARVVREKSTRIVACGKGMKAGRRVDEMPGRLVHRNLYVSAGNVVDDWIEKTCIVK